jgi:hypothetical protein
MESPIKRSVVLKEMDIKTKPDGSSVKFSIGFLKENGEYVFIPRAVACGLNMQMKKNKFRGVLPVDIHDKTAGHPTPVHIDSIISFNNQTVKING